jgi:hypothetical protein
LPETVDAILAEHGVEHIVVGHTPTSGVIWPNYGGKVLMIDTGISHAYGSHLGYLEITPEGYFAGYPGGRVPIPSGPDGAVAYLEKVIAMDPGNAHLAKRLALLKQPPAPEPEPAAKPDDGEPAMDEDEAPEAAPAVEIPICGISQ